MKKIILYLLIITFVSCKNETKEKEVQTADASAVKVSGKELFEGKGNCIACHQPNQKIIGPSIQEIATIYKAQNADIVLFLKGEGKPIVDPSQYEIMKTNFAITKSMTDEELQALEDYMYSFLK